MIYPINAIRLPSKLTPSLSTPIATRFLAISLVSGSFAFGENVKSVASMVSEVTSVVSGEPILLALKLELPDGWHSYYLNSGGAARPLEITWDLPEGSIAEDIQWPTPEIKDGPDGKSYVYTGSPVFLVEIIPTDNMPSGISFYVDATAKWQIGNESHINEEAEFSLSMIVREDSDVNAEHSELFSQARQQIPKRMPASVEISATSDSASPNTVQLKILGLESEPADFIPNQAYLKSPSEGGSITAIENGYLLTLERRTTDASNNPIPQGDTLSGILIGEENFRIAFQKIEAAESP